MATVACLQNPVPIEQPEGDESEELDIDNANPKREGGAVLVPTAPPAESSSAHTDSENEGEEDMKATKTHPVKNATMTVPVTVTPTRNNSVENMDVVSVLEEGSREKLIDLGSLHPKNEDLDGAFAKNNNPPPLQLSHRPESARQRGTFGKKKKTFHAEVVDYSSSDEDSTEQLKNNNPDGEESYPQMKMRRKTLLKIEKLTDSDSRGRDQMRSRGLSPPSSSDEENLYIGWVAYPTGSSKTKINKSYGQNRQRTLCTCIDALKYLVSPVRKVCKLCRNNKVWDEGSVKDYLLENSSNSPSVRNDSKKTK